MDIFFRKITPQKQEFELVIQKAKIQGVYYKDKNLVCIEAKITGECENICFRCGDDIIQPLEHEVKLKVSQNEYINNQDSEILDIIEVFNDKISFDEIFNSEIESIKSDYFACKKCQ